MIITAMAFLLLLSMQQIVCNKATEVEPYFVKKKVSSYHYDKNYKNYSIIHNQEIAVLVVAYNRPDYFKECIKSIEQNPESQEFVFVFALDGGAYATQQENIDIINQSSLKHAIILCRDCNYGCPKNHIDSKRFVFDWCKFKKVIILEDDVVVAPNYFSFLLNFYSWAQQYDNIGAVQAWSLCTLLPEQKKEQLFLVRENPHYWSFVTYCMDYACWNKIRDILCTFEDFVNQIPPTDMFTKERSKPGLSNEALAIRQWVWSLVQKKLQQKPMQPTAGHFKSTLSLSQYFLARNFLPAQDVMMGFAFYMHDLITLQSIVNRVIHIGKKGISTTEKTYQHDYESIKLDIFTEDATLSSFTLM